MSPVPRPPLVFRTRGGAVSLRVGRRAVVACLVLLAVAAVTGVFAMTTGDYPLPVAEVLKVLVGEGMPATEFIVTTLRLPRLLTGLAAGAALGLSGALFQSLSRNPLGSPDLIGFTTGSSTGALMVILVVGGSTGQIAAGAVLGGIATAVAVYLLALRQGVQGLRLILVGIGVSAFLLSLNSYLMTRATLGDASAAQRWLVGSLNGAGWEQLWPVGVALALLLPVSLHHGRRLALLEMGDDAARALGVPVERTRLVLAAAGVGLVAAATAAAGPIAFVALAAPQLARRVARSAGPAPLPSALMGAVLLGACDLATQRTLPQLPVGIATGVVGGLYLAWLLAFECRGFGRKSGRA